MGRALAPLGGLVFAVTVFVALGLFGVQPGAGATGAEVVQYYGDNAPAILFGDLLWLAGGAGLAAFIEAARRYLAADEERHPWVAAVGAIAASTGTILFSLSAVVAAVIALFAAGGALSEAAAADWWGVENTCFALSLPAFGIALIDLGNALWQADAPRRAAGGLTAALGVALVLPAVGVAVFPLLLAWAAGGTLALLLVTMERRRTHARPL